MVTGAASLVCSRGAALSVAQSILPVNPQSNDIRPEAFHAGRAATAATRSRTMLSIASFAMAEW